MMNRDMPVTITTLRHSAHHVLVLLLQLCALSCALLGVPNSALAESSSDLYKVTIEDHLEKRTEMYEAIESGDLSDLEALFDMLVRTRDGLGLLNSESISLGLLSYASDYYEVGETVLARRLSGMAVTLSPMSARVYWARLPLSASIDGFDAALSDFSKGLRHISSAPDMILGVAADSMLPFIFSGMLVLFVIMALSFSFAFEVNARRLVRLYHLSVRGVLTPVTVALFCIAPPLLGLLPALVLWSLVCLLLQPDKKHLGVIVGVLLFSWSILYPMTEALSDWLDYDSSKVLCQSLTGDPGIPDIRLRRAVRTSGQPELGSFALSVRALLKHNFNEALTEARSVEKNFSNPNWGKELQAIIYYAMGRANKADKIYDDLEAAGHKHPRMWYNRSKIKHSLIETELARMYLTRAQEQAPELIEALNRADDPSVDESLYIPLLHSGVTIPKLLDEIMDEVRWDDPLPRHIFRAVSPSALMKVALLLSFLCIFIPRPALPSASIFFNAYKPTGLAALFHWLIPYHPLRARKRPWRRFLFWLFITVLITPLVTRSERVFVLGYLFGPLVWYYYVLLFGCFAILFALRKKLGELL